MRGVPARMGCGIPEGAPGAAAEALVCGPTGEGSHGHPVFARIIRSIAALYDLQLHPELREEMTYPSPTSGERVGRSSLIPKTQEDLVRIRRMMKRWADFSGGFMGRPPMTSTVPSRGSHRPPHTLPRKIPALPRTSLPVADELLVSPSTLLRVGPEEGPYALAVPGSRSPDRGAHRHRAVPARPREDRGDRHRPGGHAGLPPDERGGSRAQPMGALVPAWPPLIRCGWRVPCSRHTIGGHT